MVNLSRRDFLARTALAGLGWGAASHRLAAEDDGGVRLLDARTERAIATGLGFLSRRQQADGSFGSPARYQSNVAVCSLAAMAMMAAGSTPGRGPHGREVDRFLAFVLESTHDSGFINHAPGSSHGPMYDHGFATMFLAECYGMSPRAELREKLSKAVKLIIGTQNHEGGWRYQPQRDEADVSVTVCQVMALRAARNAGLFVPAETIDRSVDYIKRCQNADGGFMYMVQGGESAMARSAAALVALYNAGIYDGPELEKGLEYLMEFLPGKSGANRQSHYFYGHYYAVQAMWHADGKYWRTWYPAIRDELLRSAGSGRQRDDGSWSDPIGPDYGTAMACLILQMPNNYLPIFQR